LKNKPRPYSGAPKCPIVRAPRTVASHCWVGGEQRLEVSCVFVGQGDADGLLNV